MSPRVLAPLLSLLVVAACSQPTEPTAGASRFTDEGLRPVPMASGLALGYTQAETTSQVLCQVLGRDEWQRLVGGEFRREPVGLPDAGCEITTARDRLRLELRSAEFSLPADATVAGRPVKVEETGTPTLLVALDDDVLKPSPRSHESARRVLELMVTTDGGGSTWRELGERVLKKIVPLLVRAGEPLPEMDASGHVRYVPTPVDAARFVDLPKPVQALQLCTAVLEFAPWATEVEVLDSGQCDVSDGTRKVTVAAERGSFYDHPARVAGRPARVPLDTEVYVVLRDDTPVELRVWVFPSDLDPRAFAERLVPRFA